MLTARQLIIKISLLLQILPEEISNYRPNSKSGKLLIFFLIFVWLSLSKAFALDLDPFNETIRILERWTSAHWGRDCFVWVVHYPRDLVEPYVESEAVKNNMTDSERNNYKQKFISDLQLNESETFLISIYSFGSRPANLSPVQDNINLLTSSGNRLKPSKYDSSLDYPSNGVVQGLVFFPKQSNKNFSIVIKGMGLDNERIFSFEPPDYVPPKKNNEKISEVVVVNLPKKSQPKKPVPPPPPPPPVIPPRPITPIFQEDSKDMADFINSVKNNSDNNNSKAIKNLEQKKEFNNRDNISKNNIENSYVSRENILRKFLALWADNNSTEMYNMLSENSKKIISPENFAKEISKSSDFRAGLKGDYKLEWLGNERAKITVEKKLLVFRSLSSRTITITREASAWKIIW